MIEARQRVRGVWTEWSTCPTKGSPVPKTLLDELLNVVQGSYDPEPGTADAGFNINVAIELTCDPPTEDYGWQYRLVEPWAS